jgi:hypothetical protein
MSAVRTSDPHNKYRLKVRNEIEEENVNPVPVLNTRVGAYVSSWLLMKILKFRHSSFSYYQMRNFIDLIVL